MLSQLPKRIFRQCEKVLKVLVNHKDKLIQLPIFTVLSSFQISSPLLTLKITLQELTATSTQEKEDSKLGH
jgi:hypothetical protein